MLIMHVITTKRLILREFERKDAPGLFKLNGNINVLRFTGDVAFKNITEADSFVINYTHYKRYGYGRWAVVEKSTHRFIGWCGLKYHPNEQYTDLGFRFLEEKWGSGYATEAAKACLNYGFSELKLNQIVCRVQQQNFASIAVIEKLGVSKSRAINFDGVAGWIYYLLPKS